MWTSWDWEYRDVQELYAAARYIRNKRLDQWRQKRMIAFTQAQFGGMSSLKKGVTIYDFWPLPGDPKIERRLATMRFMSREETKERYAQANIHFSEAELDLMMDKIKRAKEKKRGKEKHRV